MVNDGKLNLSCLMEIGDKILPNVNKVIEKPFYFSYFEQGFHCLEYGYDDGKIWQYPTKSGK